MEHSSYMYKTSSSKRVKCFATKHQPVETTLSCQVVRGVRSVKLTAVQ